ncbi:SEL1-like repeat protein [Methylotetracoccus oryzae]|uniref:sel1 repeat family protein n=1 Tax=Methylotetracoccus oryzae TaxID=1919059 RepID=UPI0011197784|nr:sel1 repeat family protein [Methylotetracoccus oryzae]
MRGPGYGTLRIAGLPVGSVPAAFSLERNQDALPYLGREGHWQAQEAWHPVASAAPASETVVELPVGPEIVDALVEQPQHVMCRLSVECGGGPQAGALKLQRPLFSSRAQGFVSASVPVAPPALGPEPEDLIDEVPDESLVVPPAEPVPPEQERSRWRVVAWTAIPLLLLAAVGGWLWWDCRVPGLPGPECAPEVAPEAAVTPPVETPPRNCAGLDGEACLAVAIRATDAGQLDQARQLLQEAGSLGAVKAYVRLAQMYDPATWAAERSPVAQPDWETAAYWYDEAARSGDAEGKLGAGRLYCGSASDPAFLSHGAELLRQAVAAAPGDAGLAEALKQCEERLK